MSARVRGAVLIAAAVIPGGAAAAPDTEIPAADAAPATLAGAGVHDLGIAEQTGYLVIDGDVR